MTSELDTKKESAKQALDIEIEGGTYNLGVRDSGHLEIQNDIYMIKECIAKPPIQNPEEGDFLDWYVPGEPIHTSQSAYLIKGEEKNILYDTLTPLSKETILKHLDELLGDEQLDYLAISHPEANHAANTAAILREFPEATLVASKKGAQHDLYDIDEDSLLVGHGDSLDLGDRSVDFHDPLFYDHAMTIYMSDRKTQTYFTADWMGFSHLEGDCLKPAHELKSGPTMDQFNRFNGYAFFWFRLVDPERTAAAIDSFLEVNDPEMIAPAHGQIITEDPTEFIEWFKDIIRDISKMEDFHIHHHNMIRNQSNTGE